MFMDEVMKVVISKSVKNLTYIYTCAHMLMHAYAYAFAYMPT